MLWDGDKGLLTLQEGEEQFPPPPQHNGKETNGWNQAREMKG